MASDVIDITRSRKPDRTRLRLAAELADVSSRLHSQAEVPQAGIASGDFLDIAQGMEQQERARLSATRLADRARRLREALARASEGEYGVCSECDAAIPAPRLLAVPDATTCVSCQSKLEASARPRKSA